MAFDPGEIDELVGRVRRSRDTHQILDFGHDGGQYYPRELFIREPQPLGEAHTERAPSLATSATQMSPAFDAPFDRSSVYTNSTAPPPLYGPETVGRHRPAVPDPIPTYLPCEFKNLSGCNEVFPSNKVNLWIDHIIDEHLNGSCPKISVCWFCDSGKFGSPSNQGEDMWFRQRLYHIARHFDNGMTAANIRPDYYFLDHIYQAGLIDESTFERNRSRGEFPNRHLPRNFRSRVQERWGEAHVEHAKSSSRRH